MWRSDIPAERDAGFVRCASASFWPGFDLAQALCVLGLPERPEALKEISSEKAQRTLAAVLARDLAYKSEAMPRERAEQLAQEFVTSQAAAKFYSNGDWEAYVYGGGDGPRAFGWNYLTGATFDAGVIAVSAEFASCVWVEDED